MKSTLQVNKVYLRPLQPSDFSKVLEWENNPENWRVSNTLSKFSEETIKDYVNAPQDIFSFGQLRLIICIKESNQAIGAIDLFEFDAKHQRAGVGVLIADAQRKNGFAFEALMLIQHYALNEIGIRNLFANILIDNQASIRLFEKAGFARVGRKKNWFNDNGKWVDELLYQKELILQK